MPITKTAKRALRSSRKKAKVNKRIITNLEIAIRVAKKSKKGKDITKAISLTDRATKKKVIHKNKAAHIKSTLSKLLPLPTRKSLAKSKIKSTNKRETKK
jgi:small subunit ribosomal protein S20